MEELDEIKCIICFEIFDRPVSLYCGHTFCNDCILAHFEKSPKCPVCKFTILNSHDLQINKVLDGMIKTRVLKATNNESLCAKKPFNEPSLFRSDGLIGTLNDLGDEKLLSVDQRKQIKQLANKIREISERRFQITPVYSVIFNSEKNDNAFIDKIKYEKELIQMDQFCFQLANRTQDFYYVPQSIHTLNLLFTNTDDLFTSLMADKYFIVVPGGDILEATSGILFKFTKMNYYSDTNINVTAVCICPLFHGTVFLLDTGKHYDFLSAVEHDPEELEIHWMRASTYIAKNFEMDDKTVKLFQAINFKFLHFLHRLKDNNREMFEKLTEHHNFTITDQKLSIDYLTDTERYIKLLFSLLRIPEQIKRKFSPDTDPLKKLKAIKQFLDKSRPYSDPVYIINYCPDMQTRKQIHQSALWLIFMTLIYSILMVHFNINFIF
jgi:hypothetical protein